MLFNSFLLNNLTAPPPPTFTGLLTPLSPASIALPNAGAGTGTFPKVTPDGTSLYVDCTYYKNQIYQFSRDVITGQLTQIGTGIVATGTMNWESSRTMAISPDSKNVYSACHNSSAVYNYTRNIGTGALTLLATPAANGCTSVAISNDGKFAYVPNVDSNYIYIATRNLVTGALTIPGSGTSTPSTSPENLILSPNGNNLYTYTQSNTSIGQFSVNTVTGAIAVLSPSTVTAGGSVYTMVFRPDGLFAYAGYSNNIQIFSVGGGGQLTSISTTTLPFAGTNYQITMSPDGQNLYVSNTSVYIYQFKINSITGALTALTPAYLTEVVSSIGNCISPDGKFFYTSSSDAKAYEFKRN